MWGTRAQASHALTWSESGRPDLGGVLWARCREVSCHSVECGSFEPNRSNKHARTALHRSAAGPCSSLFLQVHRHVSPSLLLSSSCMSADYSTLSGPTLCMRASSDNDIYETSLRRCSVAIPHRKHQSFDSLCLDYAESEAHRLTLLEEYKNLCSLTERSLSFHERMLEYPTASNWACSCKNRCACLVS
jgi:hypothetical protein